MGDELLRIGYLETIGAKALQQGDAQAHPWITHDDRLRGAPLAVGKFFDRHIVHLSHKGSTVVEGFADEIDKFWNVSGYDGMPARAESVQRIAIAEKDHPLRFTHNHLRTNAQISHTGFRKAMHDFICHFARIFYNIKNSCHFYAP